MSRVRWILKTITVFLTVCFICLSGMILFGSSGEIPALAAVKPLALNGVFGNNMVLQRNKPVKVWGYGGAEGASVRVSFAGQEQTAVINGGSWAVWLSPMQAFSEGKTLTVSCGGEELALQNVCVGELLFCSGQSNIAITVQYVINKSDAQIEKFKTYDNFNRIRLYTPTWGGKTEETVYTSPHSAWKTPKRLQDILTSSAYAAGLALNVQAKLGGDITVGVIETSTGGSCIEEWISEKNSKGLPSHNLSRSSYYNGMVYSLRGMTLGGVFWYQGEACIEYTSHYSEQLPALINQYRTDFEDDNLPVYIMQLPQINVEAALGSVNYEQAWVNMRNLQEKVVADIHNAYSVCLIDTGDDTIDADCLHPADKWEVTERAAGAYVATALCIPYDSLAVKASYGLSPKISQVVWKDGVLRALVEGAERLQCEAAAVSGFQAELEDGTVKSVKMKIEGLELVADMPSTVVRISYLQSAAIDFALVFNEYGLPLTPLSGMSVVDESSVFSVKFMDGTEELKTETIIFGKNIELFTPKKQGYDFVGWYLDESFLSEFNTSNPILSDTTLYAKFVAEPKNGSTGAGCGGDASVKILPLLGVGAAMLAGRRR